MCPKQRTNARTAYFARMGLGADDAMHIDLLPNLPTSGSYQTVMTAIDVFSR